MSFLDLSIVIVNWNTRDLLAQCLESVYAHAPDGDFEVFVVDNASTDGSAQAVRERFPQVQLVENTENAGFARANNQAIRASSGRYMLLLNSDTRVLPKTLRTMVQFMDDRPQVGIASCKVLSADGTFRAAGADFLTLRSEFAHFTGLASLVRGGRWANRPGYRDFPATREVDWVGGACLMIRRETVEQIGLLDENYFMYCEDMDWCYRARQHGWKVYYLPQAQIIHHGQQSSRQAEVPMLAEMYRSRVQFFRKHYGSRHANCLKLIVTASVAVKSLIRRSLFWACRGRLGQEVTLQQVLHIIKTVQDKHENRY